MTNNMGFTVNKPVDNNTEKSSNNRADTLQDTSSTSTSNTSTPSPSSNTGSSDIIGTMQTVATTITDNMNLKSKLNSAKSNVKGIFSKFLSLGKDELQTVEEKKKQKALESGIQNGSVQNIDAKDHCIKTPNGTAEVFTTDSMSMMHYNDQGFGVSDSGCLINGRIHLCSEPHNIRINGMWVLNEQLLTTLPSTLATPMPVLNFKFPSFVEKGAKFLKAIA